MTKGLFLEPGTILGFGNTDSHIKTSASTVILLKGQWQFSLAKQDGRRDISAKLGVGPKHPVAKCISPVTLA